MTSPLGPLWASSHSEVPGFQVTISYITVCPGRSDPFFIVSYYIKWVTTSWTHSVLYEQVVVFIYILQLTTYIKKVMTFLMSVEYIVPMQADHIFIFMSKTVFSSFMLNKIIYPF